MSAFIEWYALGPFWGGVWSVIDPEGVEPQAGEKFFLARAVNATGPVTWQARFERMSGTSNPNDSPPRQFWPENGFGGPDGEWPPYWVDYSEEKFPNYNPHAVVVGGFDVAGIVTISAMDNGVPIAGELFLAITNQYEGDSYPDLAWGVGGGGGGEPYADFWGNFVMTREVPDA